MAFTNNLAGQPLNKTEAKSNEVSDSQVDIHIPMLTINIFFDGLANNMYNTTARLDKEHSELEGQTSYENYYSNIALLYMACSETVIMRKIYIEGSATVKYEKDSNLGFGFTKGESSIYDRVTEAFAKINLLCVGLNPHKIKLNVFGFGRGAFYARYFCAMVKLERCYSYDPSNIEEDRHVAALYRSGRNILNFFSANISINLVGIYDTVSSYGISRHQDLESFKVDIGKKQGIKKIIHLTAQNDYRFHFPLIHIDTAAVDGVGFECSFPGAYADIGGSYCQGAQEVQYLSVYGKVYNLNSDMKPGEVSWKWYKKMGYYQGDPIEKEGDYGDFRVEKANIEDRTGILLQFKYIYVVYANRTVASNSYQFVFLEIMRDLAIKLANLSFDGGGKVTLETDISSVISSGGVLTKFRDYAYNYVFKHYTDSGLTFAVKADNFLSMEERQELYHKYIHNSLDVSRPFGVLNGSDDRNKGSKGPKRIDIHDDGLLYRSFTND